MLEGYAKEYVYLSSIAFIGDVKQVRQARLALSAELPGEQFTSAPSTMLLDAPPPVLALLSALHPANRSISLHMPCRADASPIHLCIPVHFILLLPLLLQGAPFAEHSPILWDISQLPSWARANEGLLKMHRGEVLGKLPVVQHLAFGSLFPATWPSSRQPCLSETMAHALAANAAEPAVAAAAARAEAASAAASVPVDDPIRAVAPWVTSPPAAAGGAAGGVPAPAAAASAGAAVPAAADGGAAPAPSADPARRRSRGSSATGDGVVAFMDAFGQPPAGALDGGPVASATAAAGAAGADNAVEGPE